MKDPYLAVSILLAGFVGIMIFVACCVGSCYDQDQPKPEAVLVTVKDGVRLYKIWDGHQMVYFTSPNGDVNWNDIRDEDVDTEHRTLSGIPVSKKK